MLPDTAYKGDNVGARSAATVDDCCAVCAANNTCAMWAYHNTTSQCHLHGHAAERKGMAGTTAGRLDGRHVAGAASQFSESCGADAIARSDDVSFGR